MSQCRQCFFPPTLFHQRSLPLKTIFPLIFVKELFAIPQRNLQLIQLPFSIIRYDIFFSFFAIFITSAVMKYSPEGRGWVKFSSLCLFQLIYNGNRRYKLATGKVLCVSVRKHMVLMERKGKTSKVLWLFGKNGKSKAKNTM